MFSCWRRAADSASWSSMVSSCRVRTPGRTALKATDRFRSRSRASKTTPNPPLPISFTISKRPTTAPGTSSFAGAAARERSGCARVAPSAPPARAICCRRSERPSGAARMLATRSAMVGCAPPPPSAAGRAWTSCSRSAERPSAPGAFMVRRVAARRVISAAASPPPGAFANCSRSAERPSAPPAMEARASTRRRDRSASGVPWVSARAKCSRRADRPSADSSSPLGWLGPPDGVSGARSPDSPPSPE